MHSPATTVEAYLASLPADRRSAMEQVRKVIRKNLDKGYEEGMQYGMIGYYVPHRVYPDGYHCDPAQPVPFAALASQKNHMSVYLMAVYGTAGELNWFESAWKKTGKKLDMGKSCVRFTRVEDVALDVIGEAIRRVPSARYIADYDAKTRALRKKAPARPAAPAPAENAPASKKAAPSKKPAARKAR